MGIPNLKRIRIRSELELDTWLSRFSGKERSVMLVTHTNAAHRTFVSQESITATLAKHQWKAGRCFTLSADLLAREIVRPTITVARN